MAPKSLILILFVVFSSGVESASLLERSYDYVLGLGKNLGPSLMSILDCLAEEDAWNCAKQKAGKMLDSWEQEVEKQRRSWQVAADAEARTSGRALEELPSKLGKEVEDSLTSLAVVVQHGVARALARKHHEEGGGIDSITISTGSQEKKKKMKKKKQKPPKIHLVHPVMMPMKEMQSTGRGFGKTQSWVIGENATTVRKGRGMVDDFLSMGDKALDAVAEHAMKSDEAEDGLQDKSGVGEQRGKKKKQKKKAILKLLILGAVLKAKIGTLLQILSFKLQVKFFILALIGLGINLARFWIDIKKQHTSPQKVIYYEHAQHQHHYDHEEEPGWGPWSRSMDPVEESDLDDINSNTNTPYRAQEKPATYIRPFLTRV